MTSADIEQAHATITALWPRLRWSDEEWGVFAEQAARIKINGEQAIAAIRNAKATIARYPTVAALLESLRKADASPARVGASPRSDRSELDRMRERVGGRDRLDIVWRHLIDAADLRVRFRGCLDPVWLEEARAMLIRVGFVDPDVAEGEMAAFAAGYPSEPGPEYPSTPEAVWFVGWLSRAAASPRAAERVVVEAVVQDVFPKRRQAAREQWERMRAQRLGMSELVKRAIAGGAAHVATGDGA